MLNLAAPTDPGWLESALADLDEVLLDHAHCEKKAAGTAIRLLFRYPDQAFLHDPLSRLAREELAHYEEVLREMSARGLVMRRQKPSAYAGRLAALIRSAEPERLVDTLLVCALIEARSCERFKLLAEGVEDPTLRKLYSGLLASEARHHQIYVDLAGEVVDPPIVRARLAELAESEAAILADSRGPARMHS